MAEFVSWLPIALLVASLAGVLVFLALGGGGVLRLWALEPVGIAVPGFACLLVFTAPQMADMFAGMRDRFAGRLGELDLGAAVFLLAVQGWFWTRAALNARGKAEGRTGWRDKDAPLTLTWQEIAAPRLTLVPATLIAISPVFQACVGHIPWISVPWVGTGSAAAATGLVWSWAWRRRGRMRRAAFRTANPPLAGLRVSRLFQAAPGGARYAFALLGIALVLMAFAQVAPDIVNDHVHAPAAALMALSCLTATAAVWLALLRDAVDAMLAWLRRLSRRDGPASVAASDLIGILAIVALPLVVSYAAEYAGIYNVDEIAWTPSADTINPAVAARPNMPTAALNFTSCRPNASGEIPAIIIAAEGGASRSAAWTLSVIRMLDARTRGAVSANLFAVIGVSGGSLGAVSYLMARAANVTVADTKAKAEPDPSVFWSSSGAVKGMVQLAHADLLSSTAARMFSVDTLLGVPSRSAALQRAFEGLWGSGDGFAMPHLARAGFLALREGDPCLPHLILSGTDVKEGKRLLTSTIAFGQPGPGARDASPVDQPFSDAIDVLYNINADIPVAAAVLNSARFPLISPPGMLRTGVGGPSNDPDRLVVDGGVFENYGARTAWELAGAIASVDMRIRPIIVLIANDLDIDLRATGRAIQPKQNPEGQCQVAATGKGAETRTTAGVAVLELLTSVSGLLNGRAAHASVEIAFLRQKYCTDLQTSLFHFDVPKPEPSERQAAPMNWTLGANTCQFLLGAARRAPFNVDQMLQLRRRLFGEQLSYEPSDMASEDSARCQGDAALLELWSDMVRRKSVTADPRL